MFENKAARLIETRKGDALRNHLGAGCRLAFWRDLFHLSSFALS
jgi:hypothetical protein